MSTELEVSHSPAHRLLAMLAHDDVGRHPDSHGSYTAILEIGCGAVRSLDLRSSAPPFLHQPARNLKQTVQLAQLEGGQIRLRRGGESTRPLRVADRTGQCFPALLTTTGKAVLVGLNSDQLRDALTGAALVNGEETPDITLDELERDHRSDGRFPWP